MITFLSNHELYSNIMRQVVIEDRDPSDKLGDRWWNRVRHRVADSFMLSIYFISYINTMAIPSSNSKSPLQTFFLYLLKNHPCSSYHTTKPNLSPPKPKKWAPFKTLSLSYLSFWSNYSSQVYKHSFNFQFFFLFNVTHNKFKIKHYN